MPQSSSALRFPALSRSSASHDKERLSLTNHLSLYKLTGRRMRQFAGLAHRAEAWTCAKHCIPMLCIATGVGVWELEAEPSYFFQPRSFLAWWVAQRGLKICKPLRVITSHTTITPLPANTAFHNANMASSHTSAFPLSSKAATHSSGSGAWKSHSTSSAGPIKTHLTVKHSGRERNSLVGIQRNRRTVRQR